MQCLHSGSTAPGDLATVVVQSSDSHAEAFFLGCSLTSSVEAQRWEEQCIGGSKRERLSAATQGVASTKACRKAGTAMPAICASRQASLLADVGSVGAAQEASALAPLKWVVPAGYRL